MSVSTETTVATTAVDVASWMQEVASAVEAEATHLTQLDSAIGDGDHGVNMTRGFRAVVEAVDGAQPPGKQLITAGKTLVSTVGGASGPLWGTALRRAGRSVGDAPELDGPALVDRARRGARRAWSSSARRSRATRRWSTRWGRPWRRCARASRTGETSRAAIAAAAAAAEEGARATVPMQARKGRASYLGERSVGHQDPGATSSALIVAALGRALGPQG